MPDFLALDGLEYNTRKAGPLDALLAPPYDVINGELRRALAKRSPYNIVHLIVPEPAEGLDRYEAAGVLLARWRAEGVLVPSGRAIFLLEQRFEVAGEELSRTAVIGRVRLGPWRESGIYPHEFTLPRPKEDRLNLYRAATVQPGPVFALFEDSKSAVSLLMNSLKGAEPLCTVEGPEGARDRVWKVTDAASVAALEEALGSERLFVADGHHRYETALAYRNEASAHAALPADHPANFVLAAVVPFCDPGLRILPTHRLLRMDGRPSLAEALDALEKDYLIESAAEIDRRFLADPSTGAIALYTPGTWHRLQRRESSPAAAPGAAGRLNVSEVRERVLVKFFDDVEQAVSEEHIAYTHEIDEAVSLVDAGACDAAVILAPLSVEEMAAVAAAGEVLPPKSTYFYPKIPTGLALNPLG